MIIQLFFSDKKSSRKLTMKRRNNAEAKKSGDKNKQKSEKPKPKEKG